MPAFALPLLFWGSAAAAFGGLFLGFWRGSEEMFKWVTVGSTLFMLYQIFTSRRARRK